MNAQGILRTRFVRTAIAVVALLGAGCGSREEADPIARMTNALGGHAAIGRLTSLSVAANCAGPDGHFRTWVESLRPGSVHFRQSSATDSIAVWSTPDSTWLSNGAEIVAGDERVRDFVRGHEFHLLLFEVDTRFSDFTLAGADTIEGHPCTRVAMRDGNGQAGHLSVDNMNDLPRLLEINPPGAAGPVRVYFDDWRRVDDLMCFFSIRLTEGPGRSFLYRYTEIVPNAVTAALFEPREFR